MPAICCKYCPHCEQIGRSIGTWRSHGRKNYYCQHPDVYESNPNGTNFISFGENSLRSPIQIKTSPRWCPRKRIVAKEEE